MSAWAQSPASRIPRRDYRTADEIAEEAGVSTRTVLSRVQRGEYSPPPRKNGREWQFAADSRYQPQPAAAE